MKGLPAHGGSAKGAALRLRTLLQRLALSGLVEAHELEGGPRLQPSCLRPRANLRSHLSKAAGQHPQGGGENLRRLFSKHVPPFTMSHAGRCPFVHWCSHLEQRPAPSAQRGLSISNVDRREV